MAHIVSGGVNWSPATDVYFDQTTTRFAQFLATTHGNPQVDLAARMQRIDHVRRDRFEELDRRIDPLLCSRYPNVSIT